MAMVSSMPIKRVTSMRANGSIMSLQERGARSGGMEKNA